MIKSGTLTGLSMQQPDNPARLAIGEISLADFRVDLTGDMIDLDTRLSMADARKVVENTSFQTIIFKNPVISDEEVEIALDKVTLRDMRDGRLAGIDITGSHITQKTPDGHANFGLDGLSVTDLDLMAITGFGEIYDVADEIVGQHIDQFEDFTLGQMNLPLSQALYGAFSMNGLSFSGAPDGEKVEIRLDSFKSTLEKPFSPENSALTFVKINNSTLEGLHATLDDSINRWQRYRNLPWYQQLRRSCAGCLQQHYLGLDGWRFCLQHRQGCPARYRPDRPFGHGHRDQR